MKATSTSVAKAPAIIALNKKTGKLAGKQFGG
jgi:hypothetical protein